MAAVTKHHAAESLAQMEAMDEITKAIKEKDLQQMATCIPAIAMALKVLEEQLPKLRPVSLMPKRAFEDAVNSAVLGPGNESAKRLAVSRVATPFTIMDRGKKRAREEEEAESTPSQRQRRESMDSQSTMDGDAGDAGMGRAEHRYSLVLATLAGLRGDDASVGKDEVERALLACDFDHNEIEAYFGRMESENRVMILEGTVHFTV